MILYRVYPEDPGAAVDGAGGPLFFPRALQGHARHDNPELYGCMYVSESPVAPVAEALAPFRGTGTLSSEMLLRAGRPLALATLTLADPARLLDLDDPAVLVSESLCPSEVATRERASTQAHAARLHAAHDDAAGLRWWSTLESLWINVTLFDRAAAALTVEEIAPLSPDAEPVAEAARLLGLASR